MRIALFHDFLVRMGGAEHVFFTLADMFPDADIYTLFMDKEAVERRYPGRTIHTHKAAQSKYQWVRALPKIGKQATKLLLPWYARWVDEMDFSAYDLVIVNSTAWTLGVITPVDTKVVCYVHSPARFLWDYFPEYKKELGATKETGWKNILLTHSMSRLRLWNAVAGQRADHMLCNSRLVKDRIHKFFRREDATVLYPPVDVDALECTGQNPEGHVLIISTLTPYKNIDAILEWWKGKKEQLVIIGDGPDRRRLEGLAPDNVTFMGYVSQEKRNELLEGARCVLYPSKEDFGIVPIEAMAAGKLPLVLGAGGALETIQDGNNGLHFPNLSKEALNTVWERFLAMENSYTPKMLRASAEKYSTATFSAKFLEYLRDRNLLRA